MNQTLLHVDSLPKKTRKEVFPEEMNQVVPWAELISLIAPHARGAHQAGVEANSRLVHTVIGTAAHVSDVTQADALCTAMRWKAEAMRAIKALKKCKELKASARAKAEHPFRVIKQQISDTETRTTTKPTSVVSNGGVVTRRRRRSCR